MNIVQQIVDQLRGAGLSKLSALLGESDSKTRSAVEGAVAALLSALSSLASSGEGAQKLSSAVAKVDAGSHGDLTNTLSGQAGAVADQGSSLLNSLFSGNVLSEIINALNKFTGLGGGGTKSLLGFLTPLILGAIGKQFAGKSINAQSLSSFFTEQKSNIANAMPAGLSLADVPGLSSVSSTPRPGYSPGRAGYGATEEAGTPALKWLLPLLGLAALALIAYLLWPKSQPEIHDVAKVTKDLTDNVSSLTDTLTDVKDAASAEAALPKLKDLSGKLDGMKALIDKLPDADKAKITDLIKSNMDKLGDQFNRVLMIPGVTDKLRPALEKIVSEFASLGGLPADRFALPSVEVTKLGSDLSGMLGSLTDTLTGVKDAASAEAALPKLTDLNGKLDDAKVSWDKLPEAGRTAINSALKSALASLKELVNKVLEIAGVGDKIKPVVDPIMTKLASLSS
jgi:hypothetical protein